MARLTALLVCLALLGSVHAQTATYLGGTGSLSASLFDIVGVGFTLQTCTAINFPNLLTAYTCTIDTAASYANATVTIGSAVAGSTVSTVQVSASTTFKALVINAKAALNVAAATTLTVNQQTSAAVTGTANEISGTGNVVLNGGIDLNGNTLVVDSTATTLGGTTQLSGSEMLTIGGGNCMATSIVLSGTSQLVWTSAVVAATGNTGCAPTGDATATVTYGGDAVLATAAYGTKVLVAAKTTFVDAGTATFNAAKLTVTGQFYTSSNTQVQANSPDGVVVQGSGSIVINGGAMVAATVSFDASTTYQVLINSATPAVLTVTGQATLAGNLVLNVDPSFTWEAGTSITIMNYGSHQGTFASVQIVAKGAAGARRLLADSATVEYQDGKAVATKAKTNAAAPLQISGALVAMLALLLIAFF